jgi:hypothetical protein
LFLKTSQGFRTSGLACHKRAPISGTVMMVDVSGQARWIKASLISELIGHYETLAFAESCSDTLLN